MQPAPALASGKSQPQTLPAQSSHRRDREGRVFAHGAVPVSSTAALAGGNARSASEANQLPGHG